MLCSNLELYPFYRMYCTRRECWCTPLPCGVPRPMSLSWSSSNRVPFYDFRSFSNLSFLTFS